MYNLYSEKKREFSTGLKYKCDRTEQHNRFFELFFFINKNNLFHFFILSGPEEANPSSFVNGLELRYLSNKSVRLSITLNHQALDNENRLLNHIKGTIKSQIKRTLKYDISVDENYLEDILDALNQSEKDFLVITLRLENTFLHDKNIMFFENAIISYYSEMSRLNERIGSKKLLTFLLFVTSELDETLYQGKTIIDKINLDKHKLRKLEEIGYQEIKDWLIEERIEESAQGINAIFEKHFSELDSKSDKKLSMAEVEIKLDELLKEKDKSNST